MTTNQRPEKAGGGKGLDRETAKGKGRGGFGPHPKPSAETAGYDPKHRSNVEPPPVKPVGERKP